LGGGLPRCAADDSQENDTAFARMLRRDVRCGVVIGMKATRWQESGPHATPLCFRAKNGGVGKTPGQSVGPASCTAGRLFASFDATLHSLNACF